MKIDAATNLTIANIEEVSKINCQQEMNQESKT